jgi:hypothetical protein
MPNTAPKTRRTRLHEFEPDTRVERFLKTRRIPYQRNPSAFIADIAKVMLPGWSPISAHLHTIERIPSMHLNFGCFTEGVHTSVYVDLRRSDVLPLLLYLMRHGSKELLVAFYELKAQRSDDDGGEVLPVPTKAELAAMPAVVPAIQ